MIALKSWAGCADTRDMTPSPCPCCGAPLVDLTPEGAEAGFLHHGPMAVCSACDSVFYDLPEVAR